MSRIPLARLDELTPSQREQYERFPSNLTRALLLADERLARVPPELANALRATTLDPQIREAVILRVARLSDSAYERMQHYEQAKKVGLSERDIDTIECGGAPEDVQTLRAVLDFVNECVTSTKVSDATFRRVANLLTSRDIVTLLLLIGHYMMVARLLETLEVDLDAIADDFSKEH